MARPDLDTAAALDREIIHPVMFAFLDIVGDPVRVTTAPYSVEMSGTGDKDLDGFVFDAIDPTFVAVSPVKSKEGGTDTVTATMSGLIGIDSDLMTLIGNKANWQGRPARLWLALYDENLQRIGSLWPFHTGYMTVPKIVGSATTQTIAIEIESYLSFLKTASNRSYLDQALYDPGDLSAEASIAVANGTSGAQLTGGTSAIAAAMAAGGILGATARNIA